MLRPPVVYLCWVMITDAPSISSAYSTVLSSDTISYGIDKSEIFADLCYGRIFQSARAWWFAVEVVIYIELYSCPSMWFGFQTQRILESRSSVMGLYCCFVKYGLMNGSYVFGVCLQVSFLELRLSYHICADDIVARMRERQLYNLYILSKCLYAVGKRSLV